MSELQHNDLRYPIGAHTPPATITAEDRAEAIRTLAEMPQQLREALRGLDDDQLDTPYRPDGWTVRQLTHHIADSHMTAFFRMRKALTEDWPAVPGYAEKEFATLHDATAPPEWSVDILEGVHARWVMMIEHLGDEQWQRGILHAERGKVTLESLLLLYQWHSRHHVAHITALRVREGW